VAKANLESIGLVDPLSYKYQEIVKPAFHAYRFMNELGDELLSRETGGIISRDRVTSRVTLVGYNYSWR
jgi:beta-xylosidase